MFSLLMRERLPMQFCFTAKTYQLQSSSPMLVQDAIFGRPSHQPGMGLASVRGSQLNGQSQVRWRTHAWSCGAQRVFDVR